MRKISDEIILEIRKKYSMGKPINRLVIEYNLSQPTICNIVHCKGIYKKII